jgi:hypothetical protein
LRSGRGRAARAACLPAGAIRRAEAPTYAARHPVTAGKFRVPILDFVFNPEILARKQFGLRKNGQTDFGNPF